MTLKALKPKKSAKQDRERQVLLAMVELFLKTGKPIGSATLKDSQFESLSSATIRNYFAKLETEGYLAQQHISGGRIPTAKAFRLYAEDSLNNSDMGFENEFNALRQNETKELATFLSESAELLSQLTKTAVFLSAPRFDHDYIVDIKLVSIDTGRCLCVLITSFGVIQTEILHLDKKLSLFSLKRIESYFKWRVISANTEAAIEKPDNLTDEEDHLAHQFYNEIMVRYIVSYANFTDEDIFRTGFSKLLSYQDFDHTSLTNCLSLFEDIHALRLLLKECSKKETLKFWIEDDLKAFSDTSQQASIIAIPFYINKQCVGAVGIMGPIRLPFKKLFATLHLFSESISHALTNSIYKYKITFRKPEAESTDLIKDQSHNQFMLIEDYSLDNLN